MNRHPGGLLSPLAIGFYVMVGILAIFTFGHQYSVHSFTHVSPNKQSKAVDIPVLQPNRSSGIHSFSGVITTSWFSPSVYRIIPDDRLISLKVNGQLVGLSGIDPKGLNNVRSGFKINLSQYLKAGESNRVEAQILDYGGDLGLSIKASHLDAKRFILLCAWALLVLFCFYFFCMPGLPLKHQLAYFFILAGNLFQVINIFKYNPVDHIWSDPQRHWLIGTETLNVHLMSLTDPIGYQLYVGALGKLTVKIPELIAYFTSILALLAPWLWYRFFREIQTSKTTALFGWAALSLLPSWVAIYSYFMQETLLLPLLGAALWATWRCRRKADTASFVIMVLLWIATGLTRGIAIPLAAVCCTWLWVAQDTKLKKALCSSIALIMIMGPLTYRSYETVNHFAPHGMGHLNVIYAKSGKRNIQIKALRQGQDWTVNFGSPSMEAKPFAPFSDWQTQRTGVERIEVDLDKGMEDWSKKMDELDMSFSKYWWITKESFILIFFADSWPDNNLARLADKAGALMRWIWLPLFIVIIVGLIVYRKHMRGQWLLPAMLLAWFVVQVMIPISINEGRYRKPFEGLAIAHLVLLIGARRQQLKPGAKAQTWGEFVQGFTVGLANKHPRA